MTETIHEKIEMGVLDPTSKIYKGGSWKVKLMVPVGLSEKEKEEIKKVVDSFDHSTLFPQHAELAQVIEEEKLDKLFHRYTVVKNLQIPDRAPSIVDMCAVIYGELRSKNYPVVEMRIKTDDDRFDFKYNRNLWDQLWSGLRWKHVVESG